MVEGEVDSVTSVGEAHSDLSSNLIYCRSGRSQIDHGDDDGGELRIGKSVGSRDCMNSQS